MAPFQSFTRSLFCISPSTANELLTQLFVRKTYSSATHVWICCAYSAHTPCETDFHWECVKGLILSEMLVQTRRIFRS